mmetsp:Transcript_22515/g.35349  ORF Transcript_22515/g.35349 Transcript_22515/m.35349 type:complete len:240 (+) Transcript_22515:1787-2506(+)
MPRRPRFSSISLSFLMTASALSSLFLSATTFFSFFLSLCTRSLFFFSPSVVVFLTQNSRVIPLIPSVGMSTEESESSSPSSSSLQSSLKSPLPAPSSIPTSPSSSPSSSSSRSFSSSSSGSSSGCCSSSKFNSPSFSSRSNSFRYCWQSFLTTWDSWFRDLLAVLLSLASPFLDFLSSTTFRRYANWVTTKSGVPPCLRKSFWALSISFLYAFSSVTTSTQSLFRMNLFILFMDPFSSS